MAIGCEWLQSVTVRARPRWGRFWTKRWRWESSDTNTCCSWLASSSTATKCRSSFCRLWLTETSSHTSATTITYVRLRPFPIIFLIIWTVFSFPPKHWGNEVCRGSMQLPNPYVWTRPTAKLGQLWHSQTAKQFGAFWGKNTLYRTHNTHVHLYLLQLYMPMVFKFCTEKYFRFIGVWTSKLAICVRRWLCRFMFFSAFLHLFQPLIISCQL